MVVPGASPGASVVLGGCSNGTLGDFGQILFLRSQIGSRLVGVSCSPTSSISPDPVGIEALRGVIATLGAGSDLAESSLSAPDSIPSIFTAYPFTLEAGAQAHHLKANRASHPRVKAR
jgi:hypothetical protein